MKTVAALHPTESVDQLGATPPVGRSMVTFAVFLFHHPTDRRHFDTRLSAAIGRAPRWRWQAWLASSIHPHFASLALPPP
jgi:hypothetical protein